MIEAFEKILFDEILPVVNKPGRYVGNELNVIKKDWSKVDVTIALVFPDLYELGMSYLGFEILYHILNQESTIAAERVYAPGIDLEQMLRESKLPLFSLETKHALRQFDVVGFTLQYELHYTNILNILELGGITLSAKDRAENEPIVIGGGPCAFNPEPMAEFFDAFIIGDGEDAVLNLATTIRQAKATKRRRLNLLKQLAQLDSVYVPQFYETTNTTFSQIRPVVDNVPSKITCRTVDSLELKNYPSHPLVSLIETTHDRYSMEIMRGCTRGCRFCNAGTIYRPVRERSVDELIAQASTGIKNTGYDEISLVSLSTSDFSQLQPLINRLNSLLSDKFVNVSFPSLRVDSFNQELARFAKSVRKSGITLAPEAGTEYLRKRINKDNTDHDLLRAITIAFEEGWNMVKLYFMIGQPGERLEDIEGMASLIKRAVAIAKQFAGTMIHISISPFVPKPHTPFQWAAQNSMDELQKKINLLKQVIGGGRVKISWREPNVSFLECVLGRGDRRLSAVIKRAWELGAKFDAWGEQFKFELWDRAFQDCGIDPLFYTRERNLTETLPWDFISKGVTKSYLKQEWDNALQGETTSDCRLTHCQACGLMGHSACQSIIKKDTKRKPEQTSATTASAYGRSKKIIKSQAQPTIRNIRLHYAKGEALRFTSHLDMIRLFERTFNRAEIKLVYSQGFNPHPRVAYGPPLPMGFTSDAEYLDVQLYRDREADLITILNSALPPAMQILNAKVLYGKYESLISTINRADYQIILSKTIDQSYLKERIAEFNQRPEIWIKRTNAKGSLQEMNIKPFINELLPNDTPSVLFLATSLENGRTVRVGEVLSELLPLTDADIARCKVNRSGLFVQYGEIMVTPLEI